MATQTYTARQTAADVKTACAKRGVKRDVDAKRVRAWVRDNVAAYDDDGYTAHLYDTATHRRIVDGMVARYTGKGQRSADQRGASASVGRSPNVKRELAARKSDATPRKSRTAPAKPSPAPAAPSDASKS